MNTRSATERSPEARLSLFRFALTGALTAALLFVLCWLGTFIPFSSPTHAYITLFTPAPMSSTQALVEGSSWSLAFGAVVGAVIAFIHNAVGGFFRD